MRAGNLAGDDREGLVTASPPLDTIGEDDHRVCHAMPFAYQLCAGLRHDAGGAVPALRSFLAATLEAAKARSRETAEGALLQFIGDASQQNFAAEALRWRRLIKTPPGLAQVDVAQALEPCDLGREVEV